MGLSITFRADAAGDIGFGHLRRCLTLAEAAAARGHDIGFLLSDLSDETAAAMLNGVAQRIGRIGGGGRPGGEIAALESAQVPQSDVMICDCAHSRVLPERGRLPELLRSLHNSATTLAVIEGLGGDSIAAECDGVADLLITPYAVLPGAYTAPRKTRQLVGSEYAILAPGYRRQDGARAIAAEARRVLITTGGADPAEISLQVLEACDSVGPVPLDVHIVVGPFFAASLRNALAAAAARSPHRVRLIEAPKDLLAEMLWCDLTVSASGLTKYELAATGTPMVLLSHDAAHAKNNQPFAALGACLDLGESSQLDRGAIAKAVEGLLKDRDRREALSQRGRTAVNGGGVARILDVIEEMTA